MRLFLLRHGEALPAGMDPARPLSPRGREQAGVAGRAAAEAGLRPARVLVSPKTRAQETAALACQALADPPAPETTAELVPGAAIEPWELRLGDEPGDVLLVGHNPFMERLSGLLLGRARAFGTGTLLGLRRGDDGGWSLELEVHAS